MEKISGIVPSSHRVSSVDLKSSQPVRPGMPSFGRPQGVSTVTDKQTQPTTAEKAVLIQKDLQSKRSLSERGPELINDMTERFFLQRKKEADEVKDFDLNLGFRPEIETEPPVSTLEFKEADSMQEQDDYQLSPEHLSAEEQEYMPPGSYIDVSV